MSTSATNAETFTPQLILVDGSSYLYRAFYAPRGNFTTTSGIPTGAVLIITRMLRKLIAEYPDRVVTCVFDARGGSFRNELYAEYKANRPPMPRELVLQLEYVQKLVAALGMDLISVSGVEADDVLGSYARAAEAAGLNTLICTGDKDLAQLVDDHIHLYDSMDGRYFDRQAVVEKFNVPPEHIIDFLALKGDSSDNIPGMSRVGDVTAAVLINELGGVEDIYARREEIASLSFRGAKKFAARMEEEMAVIRLSHQLATIRTDVPLPVPLEALKVPVADREALIGLFTELEFNRLIEELRQEGNSAPVPRAGRKPPARPEPEAEIEPELKTAADRGLQFVTVTTEEGLREVVARVTAAGFMAISTVSDVPKPQDATLLGLAIGCGEEQAWYVPLVQADVPGPLLTADQVGALLGPLLASPKICKHAHDLKEQLLLLHYAGLTVRGTGDDTMLMAHLLNSAAATALPELARRCLGYRVIDYKELLGRGGRITGVSCAALTAWAAERAWLTVALVHCLRPQLEAKPDLYKIYRDIDLPLMPVLYEMERAGALVDPRELKIQGDVLKEELITVQDEIHAEAGMPFNVSSPKQLGEVLFKKMGITPPRGSRRGKGEEAVYSTAEEVLNELAPAHKIARLALRHRSLAKLISTYTDKLQREISARTGRVHTTFHQAGTVTGRLSSSEPNLQNIPARTPEGKLIRKAFTAPPGYTLVSADYSQIELRLIAHASGDPSLIRAFQAGQDIHRATAAEVLGKPIAEVTAAERSHAKATNFGLMYGMGAYGLSRQTGMGAEEARQYIENYFRRYPKVREYMENTKEYARRNGFVKTLFGREIAIPEIQRGDARSLRAGERQAVNAPMQGSAADIIKIAMLAVHRWIKTMPRDSVRMTLQVHDELVFEIKDEYLDPACRKISELMEQACTLAVPLTVGVGCANNWEDAH